MRKYKDDELSEILNLLSHIQNFKNSIAKSKAVWSKVRETELKELVESYPEFKELSNDLSNVGYWLALFPESNLDYTLDKIRNRLS